jgi:hypothetical protein
MAKILCWPSDFARYKVNGRPLARTATTGEATRPVRILVSQRALTGRFFMMTGVKVKVCTGGGSACINGNYGPLPSPPPSFVGGGGTSVSKATSVFFRPVIRSVAVD